MLDIDWTKLPRNERALVGQFEIDVWPVGGGARYTVLDKASGRYVKGGKCATVQWAKEVSCGLARSLTELNTQVRAAQNALMDNVIIGSR